MIEIPLRDGVIRSWRPADLAPLVRHANNRNVWINLRDAFPHPYRRHDGRTHLRRVRATLPETTFAIAVDDAAVGEISFVLRGDVERVSAEVGYWLGEPFWGRGLATQALIAMTAYAIERHGLTRLYALPFARNTASCRVLEKAGYGLEARLRRSAVKEGAILDQLQYRVHRPGSGSAATRKPRLKPRSCGAWV